MASRPAAAAEGVFSRVLFSPPQHVKEVVNPNATIVYRENTADDPSRRKPDCSKARNLLGWEPKVELKEGLALMVDDFRVNTRAVSPFFARLCRRQLCPLSVCPA